VKQFVLGIILGITILVGVAYAATWTSIAPYVENVEACFSQGETSRVVIIYKNFEGDIDDVRCYPQGGVN
jgi:hypothetical protein